MKKFNHLLSVVLLMGALLIIGCTTSEIEDVPIKNETDIPSQLIIKTGTSFGFCIEYCQKNLTITASKIIFHSSGGRDIKKDPEITEEFPISEAQWSNLLNKVDLEKFNSLGDIIGCPDCADGGAEWIEINDGENLKRVTFDYKSTPNGIKELVLELRKLRNDIFAQFEG